MAKSKYNQQIGRGDGEIVGLKLTKLDEVKSHRLLLFWFNFFVSVGDSPTKIISCSLKCGNLSLQQSVM